MTTERNKTTETGKEETDRPTRGKPGPGRGNQDFGPQGATPTGVGPVDEPESRTGPDDTHREDPDPDQGWGRGGALTPEEKKKRLKSP